MYLFTGSILDCYTHIRAWYAFFSVELTIIKDCDKKYRSEMVSKNVVGMRI